MTDFATEHHDEIVELLKKLGTVCDGHSIAINIMALVRMLAVMLKHTSKEGRDKYIASIPQTLLRILDNPGSLQ